MVSDLGQIVKGMLLEEVISEPFIHSAYYVNRNLPTIQGLDINAAMFMLLFEISQMSLVI